jgi:hypothetical protein
MSRTGVVGHRSEDERMSVVKHVQRGEVYGVVRFVASGGTDVGGSVGEDAKRDLALGTLGARGRRPSLGARGST